MGKYNTFTLRLKSEKQIELLRKLNELKSISGVPMWRIVQNLVDREYDRVKKRGK